MTRTARFRLGYAVALAAFGIGTLAAIRVLSARSPFAILLVLVLLIPGRVQDVAYRDLFLGRRLHDCGRSYEAIAPLERFLDEIRRAPWRKVFIWFSYTVYTPNVEAMVLNNLGAAHLEIGELDPAERILAEALAIDPLYPIPHFNLALLFAARGDRTRSEAELAESVRLGYDGGTIDRIFGRAEVIRARIEGHGANRDLSSATDARPRRISESPSS